MKSQARKRDIVTTTLLSKLHSMLIIFGSEGLEEVAERGIDDERRPGEG
jgi:hypothetical protein